MNFIEVLDKVIIMAGNHLKSFQQNASIVGSKNQGIDQENKNEAVTALKDSSEKNALEDYMETIPENLLKNLTLLSVLGKNSESNFDYLKESVENKDKSWYLSHLTKNIQYLYSGKSIAEERNINLTDL